jgi:hypothetical protein
MVRRLKLGAKMAFVVQAKSDPSGEGLFRAEKATRKDAVKTAVDLLGRGMGAVTITDENGRVFEVQEFAKFFAGNY